MPLVQTYFPTHRDNRMFNEGDVEATREYFFKNRPTNLAFLLKSRFEWMAPYLENKSRIIEVGAGPGFSREFIQNPNLILTDINKKPWIDEIADALALPYPDISVDVVIASHMLHHVATPILFFRE